MDSKRNQAVKTAWVGFPPRSKETRLLTFPCFSCESKTPSAKVANGLKGKIPKAENLTPSESATIV
jgi:hypothetical protein